MTVRPDNPWMPWSPCGATCLPRRDETGRANLLLVAARLFAAAGMVLLGIVLGVLLPLLPTRTRARSVRVWFRWLLTAFGVQFVVRGQENLVGPGGNGALIASNHVSWLDVVALRIVAPVRLLAKSEVRGWPVLGALARKVGTLYIDRDQLGTLPRAVEAIAEALRGGSRVAAFPEGTTWCGVASGRYRPAVFQAAVDAGAAVQPVALRFVRADGHMTTAAAFVGDSTLIEAVVEVARTRGLVVELAVFPAIDACAVGNRKELARRVEKTIVAATSPSLPPLPHPDNVAERVAA